MLERIAIVGVGYTALRSMTPEVSYRRYDRYQSFSAGGVGRRKNGPDRTATRLGS